MLGSALRYFVRHPVRAVTALGTDPREAWTTALDRYAESRERRKPLYRYDASERWEQQLHEHLGFPWPCTFTSEFWDLWTEVIGELETKGVHAGPESFKAWNDGDAAFVRTIWCLTRHLR